MDLKAAAIFLVIGALLTTAAYQWVPATGAARQLSSETGQAELGALRTRIEELDRQHKAAVKRLSELEQFFASYKFGLVQPVGVEERPAELAEVDAEPLQVRRSTTAGRNVEQIEESGLTLGEYEAMEELAYQMYFDSFETEWMQRRQRYLSSSGVPNSTDRLREILGDDAYDRYLYASGRSNRVRIQRILPGSAAEQAGLANGDVVLSYADRRIFNFDDLRKLSYQGELGDPVVLEVREADGTISQLVMPRGPIGVTGYGGWRETP